MIVIGMTGGIGVGKSKASRYIAEKGYVIIDADKIGKNLTSDGEPVLEKLNEIFGPEGPYGNPDLDIVGPSEIVDGGLTLYRQNLADVVFADSTRRKIFDSIIHKAIIAEIDWKIADYSEDPYGEHKGILLDAPLLFEAGIEDRCDVVVVVTADEQTRIQRIMNRDGMTEKQIRDRMNNQMSEEEKCERADFVIDNSGDYESLMIKLDRLIEEIGQHI